jgi:hypothetical protein
MAEEKKEKWMTYLSITTVLIAVCATFSTFKGGGYGTKSLMNQTLASDQWAYFQAKSIKNYILGMQKDNLELQILTLGKSSTSKDVIENYNKKIKEYETKIAGVEKDKDDASKAAKEYERIRDNCKIHSAAFGIAVIFLQISILLSSISALAKRKFVWYISLVVGVVGVFYFFDGFFLFV